MGNPQPFDWGDAIDQSDKVLEHAGQWLQVARDYRRVVVEAREAARDRALKAAAAAAAAAAAERATHRQELARLHPIVPKTRVGGGVCWCGAALDDAHRLLVWGNAAVPDNPREYRQARRRVCARGRYTNQALLAAATDREYASTGGLFSFPHPEEGDTYIEGLHARVEALRRDNPTLSPEAAVTELLLRVRWDPRQPRARELLSTILRLLWIGSGESVPSTLHVLQ